jgi:DNA-binding transcriptional regulator LsrR (DeoR family)
MKKLTQQEVAKQLGLKWWNLSRYIRGVSNPRLKEAERLVKIAPETTIMMWLRRDTKALKRALKL